MAQVHFYECNAVTVENVLGIGGSEANDVPLNIELHIVSSVDLKSCRSNSND